MVFPAYHPPSFAKHQKYHKHCTQERYGHSERESLRSILDPHVVLAAADSYSEHSLQHLESLGPFTVDIDLPALLVRDRQIKHSVILYAELSAYLTVAELLYLKLLICESAVDVFKGVFFQGIDHKLEVSRLVLLI